jgi:hypothetical protein
MAELRATPMSNPIMGLLADRLKKAQQFGAKPFGYENPPVEMLMNLLGVPAVQQTMERMAYGEPLTTGRGMTTKPRAEAVEAALAVAPVAGLLAKTTKNLPVGASIKPINLEKGIYKADLTMEEMLKVRDIPTVERVQKSVELVGEKQFEKMVEAQFKKYKPSSPEQEAMLVESVTLQILGKAERSPFPRQEALDTAQRNAALPVKEGGLGLPKDNTPEMRAEAMGFDTNVYHGSRKDFTSFRDDQPVFAAENPDIAKLYGNIIYPLKLRGEQLNVSDLSDKGSGYFAENLSKKLGLSNQEDLLKNSDIRERELINAIKDRGFDRLKITDMSDMGGVQTQYAIPANSSNIRSRFAAFDPMRRNEPDILAGVLPLGLLADEEQRKKLYELMPSLLGE